MPKYLVKKRIQRNGRRVKSDAGVITIEHDVHEPGDVVELSAKDAAALAHVIEPLKEGNVSVTKPTVVSSEPVPATQAEQDAADEAKSDAKAKDKK